MSFADLLIVLLTTSAQLIGIVSFAKVADEKVKAKKNLLHTTTHTHTHICKNRTRKQITLHLMIAKESSLADLYSSSDE